MKRYLALFLAIAMMIVTLAGCGGQSSTPAQPPSDGSQASAPAEDGEELTGTLVIWSHQNPAWNEAHQKKIDEFMALHPGVTIKYEAFPYMDFKQKTQTSLLTDGGGADIYEMWGGWALDYAPTGALAKVPDEMAAKLTEDAYPSALGGYTHDGAYYGVPLEFNIEYGGMLVNKKLFEEKGLNYPATWAELEKIADETSVRKGEIMEMRGFEFATGDGLLNMFMSMMLSKGGTYLTDNDTKVDFSSPQAAEAMAQLVEYVKDRHWTNLEGLGATSSSDPGGSSEVLRDACMMATVGPYAVSNGASFDKTYGVDYDYVSLPSYGEKTAFVAETGWGFCVPEKSKQKELAWEYIKWFMQPENMLSHNIACSQVPAYRSMSEDPAYLEALPYMEPILGILGGGQYIGYINTVVLKEELRNIFTELVTTNNYASVEDALKVLQDRVNNA